MKSVLFIVALFIGCAKEPAPPPPSTPAVVQQDTQDSAKQQIPSADAMVARFTKYQVAIIRKGAGWTKDAPQKIEKLMADRGDYWKKMVEEGKLLGLARAVDDGDIRGVLFFKIQDKDEMKAVAADAPAVKAKLLTPDIRTVWGSTGLGADFKENAGISKEGDTYFLVAMGKGPKWSDKADSPETRQATADGMKYLYDLYKGGTLRWFGALEDMSLKLRNIMILKVGSKDEAKKLIDDSPSVKSGWNTPMVYEVKVPAGIMP